MHRHLLGVREMLYYLSYTLVYPSAPSGTLTMLRLASPLFRGFIIYVFVLFLGRVTGGVCALQGRFQGDTLFPSLLLNPPSDGCFKLSSVFHWFSECSPFLPLSYATPRPGVLGVTNYAHY